MTDNNQPSAGGPVMPYARWAHTATPKKTPLTGPCRISKARATQERNTQIGSPYRHKEEEKVQVQTQRGFKTSLLGLLRLVQAV